MSDINVIHQRILNNIPDTYEKTVGYDVYDLTRAFAIAVGAIEDDQADAEDKIDVDKLTGSELERFVYQHKGLTRKAANAATGTLTVTGTGTVTKDNLFETQNGVQFKATATTAITTTGTISIEAVVAGNSGVVGAGSITLMPVSIPGIVSVTNPSATIDGYDAEDDEALRERYYISLRTPATSGNKYHYQEWALEVVGVGGAKVVPLWNGDNTVKVIIIDRDMQPANSTLVGRAQEYIDPDSSGEGEGKAPIGAYCTVASATGLSINVAATLTLESGATAADVEDDIEAAIASYLASVAFKSSSVSYAKIGDAILNTDGVLDYESLTVNSGTSNIEVASSEVAILGTAVWSYE